MWRRRLLLGRDFARRWTHRDRGAGAANRPRVLIEEPDVAEAFAYWHLLEDHGYAVSWCPGPAGPPPRRCPLVDLGHCDLVGCADVVVSSLPLQLHSSRQVIAALRYLHPATPMIVQAPRQQLEQWSPLLGSGASGVMRMPVTGTTLLESVEQVLSPSLPAA